MGVRPTKGDEDAELRNSWRALPPANSASEDLCLQWGVAHYEPT
jgi:hypothetical protein